MLKRDEAVSAVVSAVLVFGLFSTAFIVWTVVSLPEWIADREEAHQDGVIQDFHSLQADLESLSAADEAGPVQTTIDLRPDPVALLQQAPATADITYRSGTNFTANFTGTALHLLNGETQGLPNEPADGFAATDVQQLRGLSLALQSRIQGVGGDAEITLTFTSDTGSFTATLLHTETPTGCGQNEIRFDVDGAQRILLCDASEDMQAPYRYDAMQQGNGLRGALARIGTPFDIDVSSSGAVSAELAAVWLDTSGRLQAAGDGAATTYTLDESGGSLAVTTNPQHHTPQQILWDAGGVAIVQSDGAVLRQAADLRIEQEPFGGHVRWTLVDLDGTPGSVSGDRTTLRLEHTGTTEVFLQADGGRISIGTPVATAWADFLETTRAAGGAPDASVSTTGDQVHLDLGGSGTWWVHLRIIHATATLS